jgi:undecaprenyl pyrophosphate phosphatase UppP
MAVHLSEKEYEKMMGARVAKPVEPRPVEQKPPKTMAELIDRYKVAIGTVAVLRLFPGLGLMGFILLLFLIWPFMYAVALLFKVLATIPLMVAGLCYQLWQWSTANAEMLITLGVIGLAGIAIYVAVYKWVD